MYATGRLQAAALTALTVVVCAVLVAVTLLAVPARAESRLPAPGPAAAEPTTTEPVVDEPPVQVVHDIADTLMRVTSNVDTYTGPGTGYERAGTLLAGTDVLVDAMTDDGWYRIVDGRFVKGTFLQVPPQPQVDPADAVPMWTTTAVTTRSGPGEHYPDAGVLAAGTQVHVDGRTADGWYRTADGRFVLGTQLSAWAPATIPPGFDAQRREAEAEGTRLGVVVRWTNLPEGTVGQWTSLAPGTVGIDVITLSEGTAVLAVRHEAAHQAITNSCGTASPPVAGDRTENVTDAYADVFHGGMNGFVGPVRDGRQAQVGYGQPTAEDYDAARAIAAGRCS
ncbi:MAG: hypothetical protein FWE61_01680 [Micrococcales bacterium]|nr:hypothetical protein [Micrococcales bacterium]